jgi:AcrR family transcriptional regulator
MSENQGNIVSIDGRDHRPWALMSREKLLKAAVSEIAERGYEKARLVDIAAKADLTVGSVYTWYKNKTDLFNAAIEFALTQQQQNNLQYLSDGADDRIQVTPDSHWTLLIAALAPRNSATDRDATDTQKMLLEALMASWRNEEAQPLIEPQIAALLSQYEDVLGAAVKAGNIDSKLDVKILARLFLAFPIGLSLLTLSGLPDPDMRNMIVFFERFAEVLKPRS